MKSNSHVRLSMIIVVSIFSLIVPIVLLYEYRTDYLKTEYVEVEGTTHFPENHVCSIFGVGQDSKRVTTIPSAIAIWTEQVSSIFAASKHKLDKEFVYHDFTALLLHYMSPERLQSSVKALPSQQWKQVGDILSVAFKRWKWLQLKRGQKKERTTQDGNEPRKVNILMTGGSILLGVNCGTNPVTEEMMRQTTCVWHRRLEFLIGKILGPDLVQFNVYAEGGLTTSGAVRAFESNRFSKDQAHPDIVIHAHSTNDQHYASLKEAERLNITLEENILLNNDRFVRHVLSMKYPSGNLDNSQAQCIPRAPLLLYFDDTLGNEEKGVFRNLSFSRIITSLSTYYGFGVISYADAVRDLVYANSNEMWFSSPDWPERQVHMGMGMHISSAWIVAYYFLNLATTYCMLPLAQPFLTNEEKLKFSSLDGSNPHDYKPVNGLPKLWGDGAIKGGPLPRPSGLQPALDATLTLDNVSEKWNNASRLNREELLPKCNVSDSRLVSDPCIFSWTSGEGLPIESWTKGIAPPIEDNKPLDKLMNSTLILNQGWKALQARYDKKRSVWDSWQPNSNFTNASFIMEFSDLRKPVESLEFLFTTSNQEVFRNSKVHIDVYVIKKGIGTKNATKPLQSNDIAAYNENYHWMARKKINLETAARHGDTMRIKIQEVGSSFQFKGMRFCDWY